MGFIRKIKQRGKIYYAEVENQWINGKCVQKHIRSLGTNPEHPTNIPLEPIHFSYLALRLMQEALTPNDLFEMLEKMGQPIKIDDLERIGINYDFEKKNVLNLPLLPEEVKIKNQNRCQKCKKEPDSRTTFKRRITTLSGDRNLRIHIKYCEDHGVINTAVLSV